MPLLDGAQSGRQAVVRDQQPVHRLGQAVLPRHDHQGGLHLAGEGNIQHMHLNLPIWLLSII